MVRRSPIFQVSWRNIDQYLAGGPRRVEVGAGHTPDPAEGRVGDDADRGAGLGLRAGRRGEGRASAGVDLRVLDVLEQAAELDLVAARTQVALALYW